MTGELVGLKLPKVRPGPAADSEEATRERLPGVPVQMPVGPRLPETPVVAKKETTPLSAMTGVLLNWKKLRVVPGAGSPLPAMRETEPVVERYMPLPAERCPLKATFPAALMEGTEKLPV